LPSNMNGYEYVYGSTARKMPENDPYVEKRIHRKKIRVKKYQKSKRKAIFTAVILFAVVMFVMVRYSMILHLNYEIAEVTDLYERVLAENSALDMKLKEKTSLAVIYDRAVNELGMIKADNNHVGYYNSYKEDTKVIDNDYIQARELENRDPVTLMLDKIRLFLNLK
jgi:cell division protein FtsL